MAKGSAERIRALLARIDEARPLNCFIHVDAEGAQAAAARCDSAIAAGKSLGPLHGMAVAWKDALVTAGRRPSGGARPDQESAAGEATIIRRLADAGAIPLGALNLDEFAAGGTGANAHFGRCANPWGTARITGGSSGGSAAAVAAGLAEVSIGSDAGGSTRLPAAMCGVTGLKPTYGRISRYGALARSWSMDSLGPMARSAADCRRVFDVIAGPDPMDPTTLAAPPLRAEIPDLAGLRIGVATDGAEGLADHAAAAIRDAARVLADLGLAVTEVRHPDVARYNDLQQILVKCEAAAMHGRRLREDPESIGPEPRAVIREGLLIPATRYIEALALREPMLDAFLGDAFAGIDVMMAPVYPDEAPLAAGDANPRAIEAAFTASARFTRYANYLGIPALSVPAGFGPNGMPLAFQLVGRPFEEARLLAVAERFQEATSHHLAAPPWPPQAA